MSLTALPLIMAAFLNAQDSGTISPPQIPSERAEVATPMNGKPNNRSRWFVRLGSLGALYNSRATIAVSGNVIPGGTARATNNLTTIFDIGYNLSEHLSLIVMGGIPPRPYVIGGGTVTSLGKLAAVDFGPIILTAVYRLPQKGRFQPYAGTGVAHVFILGNHDAAVTKLKVHDNWGFALQAGAEFRLNKSWGLFVDYKRLWLRLNADGLLANAPVRARVTLNPDLVSAGLQFHFD